MKRPRSREKRPAKKPPRAVFMKEEISRGDGRKFVFYWFRKKGGSK